MLLTVVVVGEGVVVLVCGKFQFLFGEDSIDQNSR